MGVILKCAQFIAQFVCQEFVILFLVNGDAAQKCQTIDFKYVYL